MMKLADFIEYVHGIAPIRSDRDVDDGRNGLSLDYIILTHEHTDHNWGVNSLRDYFPNVKLICTDACNKYVKKTNRAYFLFYYDDPDYRYEIAPADILISQPEEIIL